MHTHPQHGLKQPASLASSSTANMARRQQCDIGMHADLLPDLLLVPVQQLAEGGHTGAATVVRRHQLLHTSPPHHAAALALEEALL